MPAPCRVPGGSRAGNPRPPGPPCRRAAASAGAAPPRRRRSSAGRRSRCPAWRPALDRLGLENLDPLAGDLAPGAWPGRQGPDPAVERVGRLAPIEPLLLAGELGGIGDALGGLRDRLQAPGGQAFQRLARSERRPAAARRSCRLAPVSRGPISMARRSSIGPVSSPSSICMMVMPVSRVAGEDRALDRRRPPPARQQRGMDVEAAAAAGSPGSRAAASGHRRRPRRHRGRGRRIARWVSAVFRLVGVRTGRPWDSASFCTGEGRGCWPRPAGRGGWL